MEKGSLRTWVVAAGVATLLAACTEPPTPPLPPAPPPVAEAAPAPPPPPPVAVRDSCGAEALQSLIGRPRAEIPVPVNPGMRRVVCSSCAVTQDYIPGRQTIVYDTQTGLVLSVKCG